MQDIGFTIKIYDNVLEIIPDESLQDNSVYEIAFDLIQSLQGGRKLENGEFKVYTSMTPSYCSLEGVKSLVDAIELPEDKTLYYIRESSKKADYLAGTTFDENNPPFQVNQFVKYRAAHDTLLKYSIDRAARSGLKGVMGEIQFETSDSDDSLSALLKYLSAEAKRWEDELMGEDYRKGAKPKAVTMRSNPASYTTRLSGFGREIT